MHVWRLRLWRVLMCLLVVELFCLAGLLMRYSPLGIFNDDACYLLNARRMTKTWEIVRRPFPFLPGYSMLLAFWLRILPASWGCLPLRWIGVVFMFASVVPLGLLAMRRLHAPGTGLLLLTFLLAPPTMIYASTVMADVPFTFLALFTLWVSSEIEALRGPRAWKVGLLVGGLAGFSMMVRGNGVALTAALVLGFSLCRRWNVCGAIVAGTLAVQIPWQYFCILDKTAASPYSALLWDSATRLSALPSWVVQSAWRNFEVVARFFIWPGLVGHGLLSILSVLAALGTFRCWKRDGPSAWLLFVPLSIVLQIGWPFADDRYYLAVWPLLLLLALQASPRIPPALVLIPLLVASLAGLRQAAVAASTAPDESERWATYLWVDSHAPTDQSVMAIYAGRVVLIANRPHRVLETAIEPSQLIANMSRRDASYLILENLHELQADPTGHKWISMPPRIDLWLDRSSLMEKKFSTRWDAVYHRKVDAHAFLDAWTLYYDAVRLSQGESWQTNRPRIQKKLEACLKLQDDIPEARNLLAVLLLEKGDVDAGLRWLRREVRQYPVDVVAAMNLGQALCSQRRCEEGRAVLHDALMRARSFGLVDRAAQIQALLERDLRAGRPARPGQDIPPRTRT